MEITLRHSGGAQFVVEARHHRLVIDQPAEDGATDHGMTPAELLLASLGSSIGQIAAQYLRLRGLSADGLVIRAWATRESRPLRMKDFRIQIVAPQLTDRQLRALERSFPAGIVQNSLCRENPVSLSASADLLSADGQNQLDR